MNPPPLAIHGSAFSGGEYDRFDRAYVLERSGAGTGPLQFSIAATVESPVARPAFLIRNWGDGGFLARAGGRRLEPGKDFRFGHVERLEGDSDLVVWIRLEVAERTRITPRRRDP